VLLLLCCSPLLRYVQLTHTHTHTHIQTHIDTDSDTDIDTDIDIDIDIDIDTDTDIDTILLIVCSLQAAPVASTPFDRFSPGNSARAAPFPPYPHVALLGISLSLFRVCVCVCVHCGCVNSFICSLSLSLFSLSLCVVYVHMCVCVCNLPPLSSLLFSLDHIISHHIMLPVGDSEGFFHGFSLPQGSGSAAEQPGAQHRIKWPGWEWHPMKVYPSLSLSLSLHASVCVCVCVCVRVTLSLVLSLPAVTV